MSATSNKKSLEKRDQLSEVARIARDMGLTYGKYVALTENPTNHPPTHEKCLKSAPKTRKSKKYTDAQLFELWQQKKTDGEIASVVGVTRPMIQKWRDSMELPASMRDRDKYHLEETTFGIYAVREDDLI